MPVLEALCIHASARVRAGTGMAVVTLLPAVALLAVLLLAGCGQLEPVALTEPVTDPTQLYVRLALNHAAVNLRTRAAGPEASALQLTATPYNAAGTAIADAPAPTFRLLSNDTTKLKVTADGQLQGLATATALLVVADLTIGTVRHSDTALVNVHESTPALVLDTLSIQVPSARAVWYQIGPTYVDLPASFAGLIPNLNSTRVQPRAVTGNGQSIPGLTYEFVSLDSGVAYVDRRNGRPTLVRPGHARIVARTYAYGVARADVMTYTVQPPFGAALGIDGQGFFVGTTRPPNQSSLPTATVVAGGIALWFSSTTTPTDVTFEDPTDVTAPSGLFCAIALQLIATPPPPSFCTAGNIPTFIGEPSAYLSPDGTRAWRYRRFLVPGVYPFHNTANGAQGRVVVLEPTALP